MQHWVLWRRHNKMYRYGTINDINLYLKYYLFEDIDECTKNTDNCDINADCKNTDGSYTCKCHYGFESNGSSCIGNTNHCLTCENKSLEIISFLF